MHEWCALTGQQQPNGFDGDQVVLRIDHGEWWM